MPDAQQAATGGGPQKQLGPESQFQQPEGQKPLVLVTGSTGLIGGSVVDALSRSYRVVGLDVKPPKQAKAQTDFIHCDLTNDESVEQTMEQVRSKHGDRIASVIHLAAYYDFSGEPSPLYDKLTVDGTRRLLAQLQRFQVEQFVFSSSLLVMKPADKGEVLTEESPTEAAWDYPESKLKAEDAIRRHHGRIPVVILRIAGVYDVDCHSIPIAQQISRIYEKKLESFFFPGNAEHGQAFIYLADLVTCLVKTVEARGRLGPFETLLVAEPDVMSYAELQDRIGELIHGQEWPTIRIPKALAKAGAWVKDRLAGEEEEQFIKPWMVDLADTHYPVDISRARELLHWEPRYRLRDTLDDMIRKLKIDPKRWYKINGLPPPDDKS